MPAASDAPKSPKPARRLRSTESLSQADVSAAAPPRQVRFEGAKEAAGANVESAAAAAETKDCQPTNFPQLGGVSNQWFTAADPTRSVNQQRAPAAYYCQPQQHPYYPTPTGGSNITYIGQPQYQYQQYRHPAMANMADYSNAAPPPSGLNFQPPVPDTTFGPIPHVYMPRFDAPGQAIAAVGPPQIQFVPLATTTPAVSRPATFSVLVPKTLYNGGFTYYASANQPNSYNFGHGNSKAFYYYSRPQPSFYPYPQYPSLYYCY
ncbi:hypothetical protein CDD82_3805 [Ophiocordyceps australis]|uniref:Uncharacterized protein n=1 Tax=Ophiocordyceps australis TaxID=1399860 RepID=A0A2C5ZWG1_9HYPO|nr:hypothetical protein CDD82_3805 [Ophiocordyceps australis]